MGEVFEGIQIPDQWSEMILIRPMRILGTWVIITWRLHPETGTCGTDWLSIIRILTICGRPSKWQSEAVQSEETFPEITFLHTSAASNGSLSAELNLKRLKEDQWSECLAP